MKHLFTITSIFLLISINSLAQEFMGIKVAGTKDIAIQSFKNKGFSLIEDSDGAATMKGKIGTDKVELFIIYTPLSKTVWKFGIYLPEESAWTYLKSSYNKYLSLLTEKYGEPEKSYSFFGSPYDEGDGYEMTAVNVDKCMYAAFWKKEIGVRIKISNSKQVSIAYENEINATLDDVEKKSINSKVF